MASATELLESGEGDMVSDRDGANASRLFHVVVDAPASGQREDPADFVLRSVTLLGRSAVPLGSLHPSGYPKDRAGLFSYRYTVEARLSYLNYRVRVDYTAPLNFEFEPHVNWSFSYQSGFGTKNATYIIATEDPITGEPLDRAVRTPIGPFVYNLDGSDSPQYYTVNSTSNGRKGLKRPNDTDRTIQGADVSYPIGSMSLSRTLRQYPSYLHSELLAKRNTINNDMFLTRPPGTLKFAGPNVSSRIGLIPGMTTQGRLWDVELIFEDNDEGWFIEIEDVYVDNETGEQSPVTEDVAGEPQIQFSRYKYYYDISYGQMVNYVGAFA